MGDKIRVRTFRDLIVWQKAHQLALGVYQITKDFSGDEKYGLVTQMRRAAISIACNIVEGFARKNKQEGFHFYNIANASLEELKYQLLVSRDLKYVFDIEYNKLSEMSNEIGKILQAWTKGQKST